jgi:molybdate transport system substrate-binding protein
MWSQNLVIGCLSVCLIACSPRLFAEEISVAVVPVFKETLQQIKPLFEQETGYTLAITSDSAGMLYQKIKQGENIDVFLSADVERPKALIKEGLAISESFFVYTTSRLVLWTKEPLTKPLNETALLKFPTLAVPDPKNSVHGEAAQKILKGLNLWERLLPRIRITKTTAEAYQEISKKNVAAGFIGLAQYLSEVDNLGTEYWIIPQYLYQPLVHGAVILTKSQHQAAARTFLRFLRHPSTLKIIRDFGFRTPGQSDEQGDD